MLLDEPHAGLDEQGRSVVDDVVRAAPAEGRTVLLASHELDLARQIATREVRIAAGRVHEVAPGTNPQVARGGGAGMNFLREALLVAGKDLRIERRSRVALAQILPFGGIVVVMFAFALDADRTSLPVAAPGLFWTAVFLAAVLAIGRSFAVEEANRARDGLRLSGLDGGAISSARPWRSRSSCSCSRSCSARR